MGSRKVGFLVILLDGIKSVGAKTTKYVTKFKITRNPVNLPTHSLGKVSYNALYPRTKVTPVFPTPYSPLPIYLDSLLFN